MKKHSITLFTICIFTFFSLLLSCKQTTSPSSNYMQLDEVSYITKFPLSFSLSQESSVDLGIIGIIDIKIYDSLLIATTSDRKGCWSFFSLNSGANLSNFISLGQGPNEFIDAPWVSSERFLEENNELYSYIYDFQLGKLYKMNINETLKSKELNLSLVNDSLPPFLFNHLVLNGHTLFCQEIKNEQTQQNRYLYKDKEKIITNNLKKLNRSSISPGEDFNILSTTTNCNPAGDKIIEAPIGLNQINLYSIDDSFGKTICVGKRLDNIDDIQNTAREDRLYTYASLSVYDNYFAALRINEDELTYQTGRKKLPEIQIFDWQGEPLAELKLNRHITSFDIDFINGVLYTLDLHTDELYKYDIKDILEKL